MTYEDFQRVMKSIVKWQKHFAKGMARMRAERAGRFEGAATKLRNAVNELNKTQKELAAKMSELDEKMSALAEAQTRTGQRLKIIIEQGRDGKSQS